MNVQVLSVSSKGQISIPIEMRKQLGIENGTKLAVYATKDTIMLKVVRIPSIESFQKAMDEAQNWAAEVGYTEDDVDSIIKSVRQTKRK